MQDKIYYSSGQFARMAQVSLRTIRFYDQKNLLKPSMVKPSGARFYTQEDFGRLQQILLLKYLGFSLDDIREITIGGNDSNQLRNALLLQKKLVLDRMEQMQLVADSIDTTIKTLEQEKEIDWTQMLELIHLTGMESSLKNQYQNAGNISARIRLHQDFSQNKQGWFPWIFQQCDFQEGMNVLELGCGNGALWTGRLHKLPRQISIVVSDLSEGMVRDARRSIGETGERITYMNIDAASIPFSKESFDLVIANHVLFYCEDIPQVAREISRVLRRGGRLVCSTYGMRHMCEVTDLVKEFDERIVLSGEKLYERFGLENGEGILKGFFSPVELRRYEDKIELDQPEPLMEYIMSCHGNQNQYLLDRYMDFKAYIGRKVRHGFSISKDAGLFVCWKK